ncbi:MAG: hypothetical protein RL141_829 [Candidatus Parcubacteria bacterium]|jgi:ABC-2 type transport system ATP-binding protein
MTPAISIQGLSKQYAKGPKALTNVSFDVKDGDFFALLGANGAGKTTIIGILTGLVTKTEGTVTVCGHDLDKDPNAVKACIGVVPQEFNFNIFEKSFNIVLDQAGFYGVPRKEAAIRAEEIFKALDLWDKKDTMSMRLSGGMKRRLLIARALIHRPKILLLDEPTAGVDVELRHGMWAYLKQLNAAGTTIVLTTHYLEEVEQLCRNVVILKKGEKVKDSTVSELLDAIPQSTYRVTLDRDPATVAVADGLQLTPIDTKTADIEISEGSSLEKALTALAAAGAHVQDIRPTANKIEKAFLELTQ